MMIINDNMSAVFSSDELKTILEKDNTYNYIYFGSNMSLTSDIKIASTKANIIIDGTYDGTKTTEIIFDNDEGILFQVLEALVANTEHKTKIIWSLEENT